MRRSDWSSLRRSGERHSAIGFYAIVFGAYVMCDYEQLIDSDGRHGRDFELARPGVNEGWIRVISLHGKGAC